MAKKVTSYDQKGGITAETVIFNKDPQKKEAKGLWENRWFKYVAIPLAVTIIGGLVIYFFTNNTMSDKNSFDVTSYNQQGGITAGQVNIGRLDRQLTQELKTEIGKVLPQDKNKQILIIPRNQDAETLRFSDKIKDWIASLGYINPTRFQGIYATNKNWPADINVINDEDDKVKKIIVNPQK